MSSCDRLYGAVLPDGDGRGGLRGNMAKHTRALRSMVATSAKLRVRVPCVERQSSNKLASLRIPFRSAKAGGGLDDIHVKQEKPTENLLHDFNYAFRILQHEVAYQ